MSRTYNYIMENPGSSVSDIVRDINITEDKVRYQIKASGDTLVKDDSRPAKFSVNPDIYENEADIEERQAEKEKIEDDAGQGKPKRKILTSQAQLNKMVATAEMMKVTMDYSREKRLWYFTSEDNQLSAKSKDLPSIRENFEKWLKENF